MNLSTKLATEHGILGLLLAIAIGAIVYLFNSLIKEKDKEIHDKDEVLENVTIVLRAVDTTQRAILIELERRDEKKEAPTKKHAAR